MVCSGTIAAVKFVRSRWFLVSLGVVALVVVALAILALPMRHVPGRAADAQTELTSAAEAMKANDMEVGFEHVHAARGHVDDLTDVTDGVGAKVWSWVPVAGGAVRDLRNMASAVDEVTSALEVAEKVYPQVTGDDATLLDDGNVDMETLDKVLASVKKIDGHVSTARTQLEDVNGTAPFVGDMVSEKRDTAMDQIVPADKGLKRIEPIVDALPRLLGSETEQKYLLAMMNPSEIKYSGGSMLSFQTIKMDEGQMKRSKTYDTNTDPDLFRRGWWDNVEGNVFASPYSERITHSNIAPSWPIAGEETLRAWDYLRKTEMHGLIAVDVVAMSHLLEATGPLEVEGLGEVTSENLVQLTAGDYEKFTIEQQEERKALNRALIPAFMDRLFSGSDFVSTIKQLARAADERHFALYFRDSDAQGAVTDIKFDGDLSQTDQDYVGVFTQNLVGSKADYWQRKDIASRVKVNEDGSARVTLTAAVENRGPAVPNGQLSAYTDPTINAYLATFLPKGAEVVKGSVKVKDSDGSRKGMTKTDASESGEYFGRPYVRETVTLRAGDKAELKLTYDVPSVATVSGDTMTYRYDFDPHPTVTPAQVKVTVEWPEGWAPADEVPAGWAVTEKGASRWELAAVPERQKLKAVAVRR